VLAAWALLAASRTIAHLGWAVVDGAVLFKSGWLARHVTIARFTRVQSVELWQSPFDRRWSMARGRRGHGRCGRRLAPRAHPLPAP